MTNHYFKSLDASITQLSITYPEFKLFPLYYDRIYL